MRSLQKRVAAWSRATFPKATEAGRLKHLEREVAELLADPSDGEEMADIVILLLTQADRHGVDLLAAVEAKFAELQTREWGEPDEDGVIEHVRGAGD